MATGTIIDSISGTNYVSSVLTVPLVGSSAYTVLAVMRRVANSGGSTRFAALQEDATAAPCALGVGFSGTDLLRYPDSPSVNTSTLGLTVADSWVTCGWSKAAGGTPTPRAHKYIHSSAATSHENAAGSILAAALVPARLVVGRFGTTGGAGSNSSFRAVVVYGSELSDADVVTASASYAGAQSLSPISMLVFNGTSTPVDVVTAGAVTVTGSVSSDGTALPPLWDVAAPASTGNFFMILGA